MMPDTNTSSPLPSSADSSPKDCHHPHHTTPNPPVNENEQPQPPNQPKPEPEPTNHESTAIAAAWQSLMNNGRTYLARRELELARQTFTSALALCDRHPAVLRPRHHRYRVLGDLGWVERLSGRYERALEVLREACRLADARSPSLMNNGDGEEGDEEGDGGGWEGSEIMSRPRVMIAGEIGTVYRQLGRLEEASEAFESQLEIAGRLGMDGAVCRARGNLGIVGYQVALRRWDHQGVADGREEVRKEVEGLVASAMEHLRQSIQLAEKIQKEEARYSGHGPTTRDREARGWEAMGYGRMALCYCLLAAVDREGGKEMLEKAAETGSKGVECAQYQRGSVLPMTRYFYGHVLLQQGRRELALEQFNPEAIRYGMNWGVVTPAMAMCREPSGEHRGYLREIAEAGADLDVADPDGYTALDHAVFSGDAESEALILEGLRRQLGLADAEVAARRTEAHLRKGYREILQDKLRPLLYRRDEDPAVMKKLRRVYAETLAADPDKAGFFDYLKYIRCSDFKRFGRLPRSSDGLVRTYELPGSGENEDDLGVLLFFSYRWINQDKSLNTPDDANHTQYRRMLDAAKLFLQQNPSVDEAKLCIWMDFACVDQDNPGTGVSALPIIITQCDAVISLVDDTYYERAWCCVEAMMINQLRPVEPFEFNCHAWFEHMAIAADTEQAGAGGWTLRMSPRVSLNMKDKRLTYEHDRPKVMFLERQSRLLGRL